MFFFVPCQKRIQHQYEFRLKPRGTAVQFCFFCDQHATWFCDKVNEENGNIHFFWKDSNERAKMIKVVPRKSVTFKWIERSEDEFLRLILKKMKLPVLHY
jgi:hypothetical protein